MDYSLLIAYLRQKQYITDLEKDILDTWNELHILRIWKTIFYKGIMPSETGFRFSSGL